MLKRRRLLLDVPADVGVSSFHRVALGLAFYLLPFSAFALAGCAGCSHKTNGPEAVNGPAITIQPASQTVTSGQTATFSVAATGTAPLSYQWQKNGTAIAGATSPSYTTPPTTIADSGAQFTVVVSNPAGSVTSTVAILTVVPSTITCGQRGDELIHIPPDYNTFAPPSNGQSYIDPQYGCTVLRLTDAQPEFNVAVHHQYSSINAMNNNDTRVMLITESGQGVVVDTTGNLVVGPRDFPAINSANVPWARNSPDVFYYTNGNALYQGTVSGNAVNSKPLHTFAAYSSVIIPDQEDLSEDGDHLWLVGDTQAFLYTFSTDAAGPTVSVATKDLGCGWHKIQVTPSNKMLVTWACDGTANGQGQEIYSADGTLFWHMFNSSIHTDVGRDLRGNEIAIVDRIPDTYKDACPSGGGLDIIGVDSPHTLSCLVDVNFASTHISYRDSSQGWVLVSFFDQGTCPDYSCFYPQHLAPDWQSLWRQFYEELILVKVDGSTLFRLAHHRSRSAEYYWATSRAAISRDGRYAVFDSNMNIGSTGLNNYTDVYLITIQR